MATTEPRHVIRASRTSYALIVVRNVLILLAACWLTWLVTIQFSTRHEVRLFSSLQSALDNHVNSIRAGAIQPEDDPNKVVRYPLSELLRKHISVCIRDGDVILYQFPSHPLDGGTINYVTPFDASRPVSEILQNNRRNRTWHFEYLKGNWACWSRG